MKHLLKITSKKDLSSRKIEQGVESYEYHFLITLRKNEVNVDEFLNKLNTSTRQNWRYKELCQDKFYIFISRIIEDESGHPEERHFIMESDFVPDQKMFIEEIIKEEEE